MKRVMPVVLIGGALLAVTYVGSDLEIPQNEKPFARNIGAAQILENFESIPLGTSDAMNLDANQDVAPEVVAVDRELLTFNGPDISGPARVTDSAWLTPTALPTT